jgi:hypothetical protein
VERLVGKKQSKLACPAVNLESRVIFRAGVHGRSVERVHDLSGIRQPFTLGKWFTLAPDGAPLVLRNTSLEEIYVLNLAPR